MKVALPRILEVALPRILEANQYLAVTHPQDSAKRKKKMIGDVDTPQSKQYGRSEFTDHVTRRRAVIEKKTHKETTKARGNNVHARRATYRQTTQANRRTDKLIRDPK